MSQEFRAQEGVSRQLLPGLALIVLLCLTGSASVQQPAGPFMNSVGSGSSGNPEGQAAADPAAEGEQLSGQDPGGTYEVDEVSGSFGDGMRRVLELAATEQYAEARDVARGLLLSTGAERLRARVAGWTGGRSDGLFDTLGPTLDWLGLRTLTGAQRGAAHHAVGVLSLRLGEVEEARSAHEEAAVEAGPGRVRLDSIYGLGWLELQEGEAWRQQLPEVGGQKAQPPAGAPGGSGTPGSSGGSSADEEGPDPLEMARAAYRRARDRFVQRLRLDAGDEDTRANVELCLRRLRELEEIERQREEQQQEQNDEQQQEDSDQDSDQEEDQDEQQEEQEQDPEEQEQPEDQPQDPEQQEGEQEPEDQQQEYQREVPEERWLTSEEMKRLLDRLREIDEKGEELRERLRGSNRIPVKRDW